MNFLIRSLRYLSWTMNVLAALSAVLMASFVVLGTVMRYFVGAPLMFSDELVGLLFISMAFLAIPMGLLQKRHISVDLLVRTIRYPWRRLVDLIAILIFIAFALVFIYNAFDFADFSRQIRARSDIGSLLLWPWMMLMPAALAVAVLVAVLQLIDTIRALAGHEPLAAENRPETVESLVEKHL